MRISGDGRLYDMTFRDLGCDDQHRLARAALRTVIVSGGRAGGMDMHEMFERLHTADGPLDPRRRAAASWRGASAMRTGR